MPGRVSMSDSRADDDITEEGRRLFRFDAEPRAGSARVRRAATLGRFFVDGKCQHVSGAVFAEKA